MSEIQPQCDKCGRFIPYERATLNSVLEPPPCVGVVEWFSGVCTRCEAEAARARLFDQPQYICRDCAFTKGWTPPEGHCATCHLAVCEYCGGQKSLSHITDWVNPDGSHEKEREW